MTSASNRNGGFACEPAAATEAGVPCPCCGGTLTPQMIEEIIAAARQAPRRRRGRRLGSAPAR